MTDIDDINILKKLFINIDQGRLWAGAKGETVQAPQSLEGPALICTS